ncbi:nucleotidyl transferase AbiEii/AbiGii toxin family protein [Thioclava sp. GXIMD4215]|uniref:nucleotidyl transferase AbiEii/AbiGii toxin family protein n=1 Tax=Thioclava sp. GXIMD4215 TaxID=3131928 RepID=UPI00311AED7E
MNTPYPSRWPELLSAASAIIDQANLRGIGMTDWTFGGGTALMLQINHRESHDIDIFVSDPQYLAYLNPVLQGYDIELEPTDYEGDGASSLKLVFDGIGEVDFICCTSLTNNPFAITDVLGTPVRLETPAEILAKKIYFRGKRLQPRDIYDIAAVAASEHSEESVRQLSAYGDACTDALQVIDKMNHDFVRDIMKRLLAHEGFRDLHMEAKGIAADFLQKCLDHK